MLVKLCALTLALLAPVSLAAQNSLGQITGSVTDNTGASVVAARVTAVNNATNVPSSTVTSSDGLYNLLSLIPGIYTVTVQKTGFDRSVTDQVIVESSQITTIDAKLRVGTVSTTVEVTASAAMLSAANSDVATTVARDLLADIPYTERNAMEAAMLVPGVRGDPNSPGQVFSENAGIYTANVEPGAATNMGGGMPGATAVMVDGSNVTQASFGRTALTVSGDMVQEVTVITNGVSAKYGNTGGGVIIQSTRSGTNDYHGTLSWRHTDPPFNAEPLGNTIPNEEHQNFFGAYFGGPVWLPKLYKGRNKTFFFAGFEPARLFNATSSPATIPTPAELSGHFADAYSLINTTILSQQGLAAALAAPRTGGLYYQQALNTSGLPTGPQLASSKYVPIPNNDVSAQLAGNKFAQYVLSLMPTPQNPGPFIQFYRPDGLWLNNGYNAVYLRGVTNVDNRWSFRVDHVFNDKDRMYLRWASVPLSSVRFQGYPLNSVITQIPSDNSAAVNFSLDETHIITPTMINEVKILYSRNRQTRAEAPASLVQDFGAAYGLTPAVVGKGFPVISFSSYTLGTGTTSLNGQTDSNYQFSDDVTWTKGKHPVGFGVDIRRQESNQYNNSLVYGGKYTFAPAQTNNGSSGGNSLASFDLGLISAYSNSPVLVPAYYRWHYYGGYFQDDYKILPKLTLNIGVRYEFQTPRIEKYNNQGTFLPGLTGTLNGTQANGAFCFSGACGLPDTLWPANHKGFEPRIGISWAPYARMTVRASYGLMRVPLTGYGNTPLPDFNIASQTVGGTTGGIAANQPVNYLTNQVGPLTSAYTALNGARGPLYTVQGITVPYVNQTNAVPYVQQWGLTLQFQVDSKTLVQAGYSGTVGTHLVSTAAPPLNFPSLPTLNNLIAKGTNFSPTNIPNPYGITQNGAVINENLLSSLNPYQNFFNQNLQETLYRMGQSNYHALLIGVTHRLAAGLTFQSSFTWSKSIDNAGGSPAVGASGAIYGTATVQYPFNLKLERAVSNFDVPAKLTSGYSYQIPLGKGFLSTHVKIIDKIIGGWVTSGTANMQSGMVFVPSLGSNGYFVSTGGGTPLPAGVALRPDIVAGQACKNSNWNSSNPFSTSYLNLAYFAVPGSLNNPAFGNAPRTLTGCRSPRLITVNGSLMKRIPLGGNEKRYLQLSGDFLNLFNHALFFYNPNSGLKAFNSFNTASLTNPSVPAFTYQSSFAQVWQPNSALMSRVAFVQIKLYF